MLAPFQSKSRLHQIITRNAAGFIYKICEINQLLSEFDAVIGSFTHDT